jgi:hypothetical protein
VGVNGQKRILLLAARQPEVSALLEDAGFEVDARRRPLDGDIPEADVAVVFRGRLIGRNQAAILNSKGVRVIEVLMSEPTSPSTHDWLRLSHRIPKSDLVQIIRSVADAAE